MSLPVSGSRVRVLGRAATTDAYVVQAEPGRLSLRIPDGARGAFGHAEAVAVEWLTERGLRSATGSVAFETAGAFAVLGVLMAEGAVARRQRRRHVRAPMRVPILVSRQNSTPGVAGTALDVSGGGIRAHVPLALAPGESVLLTLSLPRGQVRTPARVVRAGQEGVSFQFVDLADEDRDRVIAAVFERLRRLPRVRGAEG